MIKPIDSVKDAIRSLHEHISALGVAAQEAAGLLRKAITDAIDEITGGSKKRAGRPARAAAAPAAHVASTPKARGKGAKGVKVRKAGKGGKRGAKPGGRQLKAFLGVKVYDALSDDLRSAGRDVITAMKDEWKGMSKKEQGEALGKAGVHASAGGATPAKVAKVAKTRKPRKAKAAAAAPKVEASAS